MVLNIEIFTILSILTIVILGLIDSFFVELGGATWLVIRIVILHHGTGVKDIIMSSCTSQIAKTLPPSHIFYIFEKNAF